MMFFGRGRGCVPARIRDETRSGRRPGYFRRGRVVEIELTRIPSITTSRAPCEPLRGRIDFGSLSARAGSSWRSSTLEIKHRRVRPTMLVVADQGRWRRVSVVLQCPTGRRRPPCRRWGRYWPNSARHDASTRQQIVHRRRPTSSSRRHKRCADQDQLLGQIDRDHRLERVPWRAGSARKLGSR